LIGGNFRQLFTLAIFAEWLSYIAASSSLFVFRNKMVASGPRAPLWQYPMAPAFFIVASTALLYYTFTSNLRYSAMGSLVILAGIPVYFGFAARRK
jgi:basic amino acid/polyamine antiporter, APA family